MKKHSLLIVFIVVVSLGYAYKYFWLENKNEEKSKNTLVSAVEGSRAVQVASCSELESLVNLIEGSTPNLAFLAFVSDEEKIKTYSDYIIDQFIISKYLVKKYIQKNKIDKKKSFIDDYEKFFSSMESAFYNQYLIKELSEKIFIDDKYAEKFYENNQSSKFSFPEFTKETPGSEIYLIEIPENKSLIDFEGQLKSKKDGILIERLNQSYSLKGEFSEEFINTVSNMKNGEIAEFIAQNGIKYGIYKINEHKGSWLSYDKVAEKVKQYMMNMELNKEYTKIMENLKAEYKISINMECLKDFIKNKFSNKVDEDYLENAAKEIEKEIITEEAMKEAEKKIQETINNK